MERQRTLHCCRCATVKSSGSADKSLLLVCNVSRSTSTAYSSCGSHQAKFGGKAAMSSGVTAALQQELTAAKHVPRCWHLQCWCTSHATRLT